jgi:hypothetical protein
MHNMHNRRMVQVTALLWRAALLIALAAPLPAMASASFEGNWVFKYSCSNATGIFAERCLRGEGDYFELFDLTQDGDRICGYHVATAYGQNKVDEGDLDGAGPSIYGTVAGRVATVQFRSAWTGAIGVATMTLDKGSVIWHVVKPAGGQNGFPDDAPLNRDLSQRSYRTTICDAAPARSAE